MKKLLSVFGLLVVLTGCATQEVKQARPAWIDNPGNGASASCTTHVRGRHYQEDLAILRAREQLAARMGVTIKMTQNVREVVVNDSASVTSVKNTQQTIDKGNTIYAQVKEKWHDTTKDELWVWVVPVK